MTFDMTGNETILQQGQRVRGKVVPWGHHAGETVEGIVPKTMESLLTEVMFVTLDDGTQVTVYYPPEVMSFNDYPDLKD